MRITIKNIKQDIDELNLKIDNIEKFISKVKWILIGFIINEVSINLIAKLFI